MFATKGRLKVTLFVVGALAIGFGMYGAFQVDEVYGGWAYQHDTEIEYDERKYSSSSSTKMVTCTICNKVKREQKKRFLNTRSTKSQNTFILMNMVIGGLRLNQLSM